MLPEAMIQDIIKKQNGEPFLVADIGEVVSRFVYWKETMTEVEPFYAMKCNNDPFVLETLAALGSGFDCASVKEIETILNLNVDPSRIIYANPCKSINSLKYASIVGVDLMTFDNEMELHKIHAHHSKARLVIRIKVDDRSARIRLSEKFGCEVDEVNHLLQVAKELNLNIVGVSFYAGHCCTDIEIYSKALSSCRKVFDLAEEAGFNLSIMDIGGGFTAVKGQGLPLKEISRVMMKSVHELFSQHKIRIIAEPGTYLVRTAFTLYANVIGKREKYSNEKEKICMYFINEGIYGLFHHVVFHNIEYKPFSLSNSFGKPLIQSSIWGPTCDSVDCVVRKCMLPNMEVGEWMVFENMGSYTTAATSSFNGFMPTTTKYFYSDIVRARKQGQ